FRRPQETASAIPKATWCTHRTCAQPIIFGLSRRSAAAAAQLFPSWRFRVTSRHRLPLEILSEEMSAGNAIVIALRCQDISGLAQGFQHTLSSLIVEHILLKLQGFVVARKLFENEVQQRGASVVPPCGKEASSFRNRLRSSFLSLILEDISLKLQYFVVARELLQDGIQQ